MLTFLRVHQKTVLIAVTAAVVVSFFFFGASSGGGFKESVKETPLGKALDGKVIMEQKVKRMTHFLCQSHLDLLDDKVSSPNLLNDGVLEKDFIKTSVGVLLAEKIFPKIEPELRLIVAKAQSFSPYHHPQAPLLNARSLWAQFAPEATHGASSIIQTKDKPTLQTFRLLSELYSHQKSIPLTFFKRMIFYQQNQDSRLQPDEGLARADMSLFGFHSAEDWFGPTYVKAAAQVIINGAAFAKSKGLTVSTAEVREQLLANVAEAAKKSGESIPSEHLYAAFLQQVRKEGMEEIECLEMWKEIALFRKLRSFFADSFSLDPTTLQKAYDASKDLATTEIYSLPTSLQFKDFSALLKLQMYVEAVSSMGKKDPFLLPKEFLSLAEIEKKMPELVRKEYTLEFAELDITKALGQVGLKEMWNWQSTDLGWSYLEKQFSFLQGKKALKKENRLSVLEELEDAKRAEVDAFAKQKILSLDKSRIQAILASLELKQDTSLIGLKGEGLPCKSIQDKMALKNLLELAALKSEASSSQESMAAKDKLLFYTEDDVHYYKISVVERSLAKKILTFTEADSLGILRQNLDKKLEALYPLVRKKDTSSYLQKEGSWKPLAEVKEKVGLFLYPELCDTIVASYNSFFGKEATQEQKNNPHFYTSYWALSFAQQSLEDMKNPSSINAKSSLARQWDLNVEIKTVGKDRSDIFRSEEEFFQAEGLFSSLHFTSSGKNLFFKVIARSEREKLPEATIEAIKAPLRKEAEEKGFLDLFEKIEAKKTLYLDTPA